MAQKKTTAARRFKHWMMLKVLPWPGALLVRLLHWSARIRFINRQIPEEIKNDNGQYIMAFWHGTLLLMVYAYVGNKLTFLVSWHRDGEFVTRVMKHFKMDPTRGSSSKGGMRAFYNLLKKVRKGYDIAFTPDGPKGPARIAQLGVVQTARLSGLPIVPIGMACHKKKSCAHGTRSSFRFPFPEWFSFTASPFTFQGMPTRMSLSVAGWR